MASVAIAPIVKYTTTMEQARRSKSFSIRLPKMCTSSSPLRMETAVSTTSSMRRRLRAARRRAGVAAGQHQQQRQHAARRAELARRHGVKARGSRRDGGKQARPDARARVSPAMVAFLSVMKKSRLARPPAPPSASSTARVCRRSFFQCRRFLVRSCQTGEAQPARPESA